MRSEQEIFDDLSALAGTPGFVYAIAAICLRDNTASYEDELRPEDMTPFFSPTRLNHNEVMTLIGLLMRAPIDFTVPTFATVQDHIEKAEKLLTELHHKLAEPLGEIIQRNTTQPAPNPFESARVLREPIFYAAESAYPFQYRDLAPQKYRSDSDWLLQNKGIDLQAAVDTCHALATLFNKHLVETRQRLANGPVSAQTVLPATLGLFTFSLTELAACTGRPINTIRAIVNAFALPAGQFNDAFTSLHEFNAAYAYPFVHKGPDHYLRLQPNGISEALYDSPFYWMSDDKSYAPTAHQHRGDFVEDFAFERLVRVFGADQVFRNVEISKSKRHIAGEIDTLVLFGGSAIVLQAKSKKLTFEARKGNDHQLQKDFKAAVQDAVDQAFACAELLGDPSVVLRTKDGIKIPNPQRLQTVYPVTIVADHYPALAFQARQFLNTEPTERIATPLVTDVFALDAMTEMLASPLKFLNYLGLRAQFGDKFQFSHELTLLSYHLKMNLWVGNNVDLILLEDNIAAGLDTAMTVRRDNVSGQATPEGILQWFDGTPLERILTEIETMPIPAAVDFGLMLLQLDESRVQRINRSINQILTRTITDDGLHDFSYFAPNLSSGMTIYCSQLPDREVHAKLRAHCKIQKYAQKANFWFGLALRPDGSIQFMAKLHEPWEFDSRMQTILANGIS